MFHRLILKQYPGRDLDLLLIWNKQELPDPVKAALAKISKAVFDKLTDPSRPIINVTQWCKKASCWDSIQVISVELPQEIETFLISVDDFNHQKKLAKKDQRINNGINAQTEVVERSADHWKRLLTFTTEHNLVTSNDISELKLACQLPYKVPNSVRLLELEAKARSEGFNSNDE